MGEELTHAISTGNADDDIHPNVRSWRERESEEREGEVVEREGERERGWR